MRLSLFSFISGYKPTSNNENDKSPVEHRPWRTGLVRRAPVSGLLSLIGAILCAIATIAVLEASDGLPINSWRVAGYNVQPTVLLSLFATLANALFRQALTEGVRISWWTRAQKGTSIGGLHRTWLHGSEFWPLVTAGRQMGSVGVASLLVVALLVDGPLLQRASSIGSATNHTKKDMTVAVAPSPFMSGATGMYADHDWEDNPSLIEPGFAGLLQAYNNRQPIEIPGFVCHGRCEFDIVAPGFDVHCGNWTSPYRLMTAEEYQRKLSGNESVNDTPRDLQTMFWSNVTYDANNIWPTLNTYKGGRNLSVTAHNYTYIPDTIQWNSLMFSSMWKITPTVKGQLNWRYCVMQEAIQRYPVVVVNQTVKIQPRDLSKNLTEYMVIREGPETSGQGIWPCTLGGLWLAINRAFSGSAQVRQTGMLYSIITNTSSPLTYINARESWMMNQANVRWKDPIDDMINMLQELSLRTAIYNSYRMPSYATDDKEPKQGPESEYLTWPDTSILSPAKFAHVNRTLTQNVSVHMTVDETVYVSHRGWMLGAFAAMALAFFGILPLFASWAELGRDVSLNPIETARAFDAPLLRDSDPNGTASELVAGKLGNLRVRYGASHPETGDQEPLTYEGTKAMMTAGEVHEVGEEGIMRRRLRFGRENTVEKPREVETFGLVRAESLALYSRSDHGEAIDR